KSVDTIAEYASRRRMSFYSAMQEACRGGLPDLPKAAIPKLTKLLEQIKSWTKYSADRRPSEVLDRILNETDYIASLGDPQSLEVISRRDNIEELKTSIITMETNRPDLSLSEYLENVALVSVTDDLDPDEEAISLMTLHAAKGLE